METVPSVQRPTQEFYQVSNFSKCIKNKTQSEQLASPNSALRPIIFCQILRHSNTLSHDLLRRFIDSLLIALEVQMHNRPSDPGIVLYDFRFHSKYVNHFFWSQYNVSSHSHCFVCLKTLVLFI